MLNNNDPVVIELQKLRRDVNALMQRERMIYGTGTWVPSWSGSSTAGAFTYTTQVGVYTQVERLIFVSAHLLISAIGTPPVGNLRIAGLPFTCEATYDHSLAIGLLSNIDLTAADVQLTARVAAGSTLIALLESFDNLAATFYPAANFTNVNAEFELSGWYRM